MRIYKMPVKKKYSGAIRTGIYCRVSSTKKAQLESLTEQISALTAQIAYLPDYVLCDTYVDIASGSTLEGRPGFQRLISDCASGKIQYVITKSASRFGRDVLVALSALKILRENHVKVYFVAENIFSDNPDLQVYLNTELACAEMNNKSRSENIQWGIDKRAELGTIKTFDKICYGYKHDKEGHLVIKNDEADIVRLVFRWYLNGYSIIGIIKELERYSIPSPSGKETWNRHMIEKTLRTVKYAGDSIVKTKTNHYLFSDHHPAIIPRGAFDAVQLQLSMRSNITQNPDGSVERKSTKYSSKKPIKMSYDEVEYEVDFEPFSKKEMRSQINYDPAHTTLPYPYFQRTLS